MNSHEKLSTVIFFITDDPVLPAYKVLTYDSTYLYVLICVTPQTHMKFICSN